MTKEKNIREKRDGIFFNFGNDPCLKRLNRFSDLIKFNEDDRITLSN